MNSDESVLCLWLSVLDESVLDDYCEGIMILEHVAVVKKYAIPYMAKHLRLYLTVEHYNIQELNAGIQPSTH